MQRYASLRQGLVGAWCPSVSGPFGYRLPDLSGYGNHGTLTNMDPGSDWVVSGGKGALDFDGSNDFVRVGPDPLSGLGSRGFSIFAWVLPTEINYYRIVLSVDIDSNTRHWAFSYGLTSGKMLWLSFDSGGFDIIESSSVLTTGNWQSIGIVKSQNTVSFYRNGTFVSSASENRSRLANNFPCRISGRDYPESEYPMSGQLDDIRIYNRALSEQEIRLLASERGIGLKPERQRNRYSAPVTTPSRNRSSRFLGFPS